MAPTIFWIRTHPATSWDNIFLWDTSETTDSAVRVSLKKSNNSHKSDFLHLKFLPEFLRRLPDDPDAVFVCCLGRMDIKGNMKDNRQLFLSLKNTTTTFFFIHPGLLSSLTKKDFYNYLTWMFETFSKTIQEVNNKRTGYHTTRQTLVFDLDQFSMMNLTTKPGKTDFVQF